MDRYDLDKFATTSRRGLIRRLGVGALLLTGGVGWTRQVWAQPVFRHYPFSLGVASGEPAPDGFVLWTRLAPEPLAGGGMPMKAVAVGYEIAKDRGFREIVRKGEEIAHPELGHSVHAEIAGLEPAREYFYRFRVGGEVSQIGRAVTTPAIGAPVQSLKLGCLGCQRYEDGYFTAFRHAAAENYDVIFHYGDYIYEYRGRTSPELIARPTPRTFDFDEIYTLVDYRNRYAVYKSDPDLQAAHASAPFVVSFDDHEVDNNFAGVISEQNTPVELFMLRRQAAFQAWYENMPLRKSSIPNGPHIQAFRRLAWGDLADIHILDTRQYRTDQPCGDVVSPRCGGEADPSATILGKAQTKWLEDGLKASKAPWNVLAQQVQIMQLDRNADPAVKGYSPDKWDGYLASRKRLFDLVAERDMHGMVVLTGDVHNNWASELWQDFENPRSKVVGSEFVATSITSGGDGTDLRADMPKLLEQNPHVKFANDQRGYLALAVGPDQFRADYRVVEKVTTPGAPISTRISLMTEKGKNGIAQA